MKSGLLGGLYALRAIAATAAADGGDPADGFPFERIVFVANPDEEIGSPTSTPHIRQLASRSDVCLVLECARANGDIVSARKGITDYEIVVTGRAAHAGVEPEKGRNAIVEAARQLQAIGDLHGRWPDVSVNVGTIAGGTRTNVVPARCVYGVDVRSPSLATLEEAEHAIEAIAGTPGVLDTTTELHRHGWHRPMEKGEGAARLVALVRAIATELGFEVGDAATGGASDANTIAAAGTPTIDGLGPIGGDDHAPAEWLDLDSVVPRTALLAALIARA
jgi:glutamate carboxypeptidase